MGEVPRRFSVLRSLATFHLYRGEFDKTASLGHELLELAEQADDVGLRVDGPVILGASLAFLGDPTSGLGHLDRAIALFDPLQHHPGRFRLGPSPAVGPHPPSAFLLWLRGHPDGAVERAAAGLELAQKLNHPFTHAYALFHVGYLDLWRRDFEFVHDRARGVLEVAQEHDYLIWTALGLTLHGVSAAGLGRPESGLASIARESA